MTLFLCMDCAEKTLTIFFPVSMSVPTKPSSSAVAAKGATLRWAFWEGAKAVAPPRARRERTAVFMVQEFVGLLLVAVGLLGLATVSLSP